ncbi:MAG: hypothetical protein ACP5OP_05755 [Leptospirillia bacterium]
MFGNGSGSPSTAAAANQVAGIDIANNNYSGAISVLTPFCPNNNCQNADLANTLANAYMAMGNSSAGTTVTGTTSVTGASGEGATVSQILSSILNLVKGGSSTTTTSIIQAVFQAVPCISNNTCTQTYLDNLATAVQVLANTPCSGSTSVADNCPDSSTIIVADMLYILAAAQYDTGLAYNNGTWEVCQPGGGGLTGCTSLSSITGKTIASTQLSNMGAILDNISVSGAGTPSITINNANIVNVVPYFLTSFGTSNNSNIVGPINQFLNSINCYATTNGTNCAPSNQSTTAPASISFSSSALTDLLDTL